MSVNVTNRHTSSFEITLTMACDHSDNMVESYTCDVSNGLGGSNQTHYIEGLFSLMIYVAISFYGLFQVCKFSAIEVNLWLVRL